MTRPLCVLEYLPAAHYPIIAGWYASRSREPVPEAILPKLGVIVADGGPAAAMWLYMDNSVGVCFLEHVSTRPGLCRKAAREAIAFGVGFLKERAAAMGYGVMVCHTTPVLARFVEKMDFVPTGAGLVSLSTFTRKDSE